MMNDGFRIEEMAGNSKVRRFFCAPPCTSILKALEARIMIRQ